MSLTFIFDEGENTQITVGNVGCAMHEGEYEFYLVADEHLEGYGGAYVDGDIMKVVYTLDAKTYALAETVSRVEKKDGTVEEIGGIQVTYNPERPKPADEMYQFMTESKDRHTVTIILDPNTENEKTFSADLPAGSPVYEIQRWKLLTTER